MPPRTQKTATGKPNARKGRGRKGARKPEAKESQVPQEVQVSPVLKTARPSPISQLAPEIFERIFAYYLMDWRYNSHSKIARVCRFWKEVLYSSKRLWSSIDLTLKKKRERCLKLSSGVPLEVVWDSRPLRWQRSNTLYPCDLVRAFSDRIDTMTIIDMSLSLQKLCNLSVPALQALVLEQYEYGLWNYRDIPRVPISLPHDMCKLQTLYLCNMPLNGRNLHAVLRNCHSLSDITMLKVIVDDTSSFTEASVSLRKLRRIKLHRSVDATVPILCALRDLPMDVRITLGLDVQDFTIVANNHDWQLNFCPLRFSRADVLPDRVQLVPPSDSSRIDIRVDLIFGLDCSKWSNLRHFVHEKLMEKPVLDTLCVCRGEMAEGAYGIPMAQLPPFKDLVVQTGTAVEVFDWLLNRAPQERCRLIESITLDGVYLATLAPGRLVKEILPDETFDHWNASYRAFHDLQEFLKARQDEGSPVKKLSFRRVYCDNVDKVAETLRPLVDTLVTYESWAVSFL